MAGNLTAMIASIFSGSAVSADPYFEYTTLLLPGNGTNGAQNNTFLDGSTNNFTITRNGNTTQGTFSPFSQTGWGNYFDGTGDYLSVPANAAFQLGTGDFSIEAWIYPTTTPGGQYPVVIRLESGGYNSNGLTLFWRRYNVNPNGVSVDCGGVVSLAGTSTVALNTWTHVAVTRTGTTFALFVNGTREATTTSSNNFSVNDSVYIGDGTSDTEFPGYISNVRIVKGSNVYGVGTTLTVPTAPLTAISGTSLLTCQSNRFIDNSGNNFTVTPAGNASVQAFSPFNPTASWLAATNGGSGYFDGSGDYLSVPNSANLNSTGDFTIEGWAYITSASSYAGMFSMRASTGTTNGASITFINTGYIEFAVNPGGNNLTTPTPLNQWFHVALVRSGSSTNNCSCYLNGTRVAQFTSTSQANGASNGAVIGRYYADGTNQYWVTGYLSNVRYVVGTAVYSGATITVPTAPLTAISGTQFLCNFTNAGIYDATSKNDLETVGDARISTAITAQWGSGSIYFDGTGDYLTIPANALFAFGTGDFTVEMFVNTSNTTTGGFISHGPAATSGYWAFELQTGSFYWQASGVANILVVSASSYLTSNTWTHLCVSRSSGTTRMYANGTQIGSATDNTNYSGATSGSLSIGRSYNSLNTTGYMQDVRITKGYARYVTGTGANAGKMVFNGTNTLALPTAAFPTL